MGRPAKPLEEGTIDRLHKRIEDARLAKAHSANAKTPEGDEAKEVKKPRAQVVTEIARKENKKIEIERTTPSYPLVIEYKGKRTAVVDPNSIWATRTPTFLQSEKDMILHVIARKQPKITKVVDIETFGLRAGVLNHAIAMAFTDDGKMLDKSKFGDVQFFPSWQSLKEFVCETMKELIIACENGAKSYDDLGLEDGLVKSGKEAKIYAHFGSRFDFVGFALSIGMDRNTDYYQEIRIPGKRKPVRLDWSINTFAGRSNITIMAGRGGEYRLKLIDSGNIMPVPLKDLGDSLFKGETPEQFTDPIAWINKQIGSDGYYFDLTLKDVRPYLLYAHKKPLHEFEKVLSPKAYEALTLWKNTIDDSEYSCADIVVLANALKRFSTKFRDFAEPLTQVLGEKAVRSLSPLSFNTASTAGFALSAAYWYESRLEVEDGNIRIRKNLAPQLKKDTFALVDGSRGYANLIGPGEVERFVAEGIQIQDHGIVEQGETVIIRNPVWTSRLDNRFARMAQNGSQTTVFKPLAHRVVEFDINSSFPNAMTNGCRKLVHFDGCELTRPNGEKVIIPGRNTPIPCNALIGFEDPGYRQSMPTQPMISLGLATQESMTNEHGEQVKMWVVRGRSRILHMLQFRNGEFTCVLPPSANPELYDVPLIPLRTPGRGLDSRLINAAIVTPTMALIRGEYLAAYAASPTLDDDAMVVYLCEITPNEYRKDKEDKRDRSRHGPIMGVAIDATGKVFGKPHMPHAKFNQVLFNTRLAEKNQVKKSKDVGDDERARQHKANADMTKLIMNGGGYGTYAQNKQPEIDFNLGDLDECMGITDRLRGLDPAWMGMRESIKMLSPDYPLADECGWGDLYAAFEDYRIELAATIEQGYQVELSTLKSRFLRAMKMLFSQWGENQITHFSTYTYRSQVVDADGEPIRQTRGIITTAEETANHAIRPYASAVVAKAAINLHEGQLAVHRSPFGLAYSDTDSVHIETGRIKPFSDAVVVKMVLEAYAKRYGSVASDHRAALEQMMNEDSAENLPLIIRILKHFGLDIGENLGQWGAEKHTYTKGLVADGLADREYYSHRTFYLGPKIYVDLDRDNTVARTKVRSVPKTNPLQPAVFRGYLVGTPTLADRRGLHQETFRKVQLDGPQRIKIGKRSVDIEAMFSNPRRIYDSESSSRPFELRMPAELEQKILAGEKVRPDSLSKAILTSIGLDEELRSVQGLQDAYLTYRAECRIAGRTFDAVSKEIGDKADEIQYLLDTQHTADFDPDKVQLIAFEDGFDEEDYVKAELEARQEMESWQELETMNWGDA